MIRIIAQQKKTLIRMTRAVVVIKIVTATAVFISRDYRAYT
jgi:hypothetical protein